MWGFFDYFLVYEKNGSKIFKNQRWGGIFDFSNLFFQNSIFFLKILKKNRNKIVLQQFWKKSP